MPKGKLIVIEGGDGSGKETQVALLVKRLEKLKLPVARMAFPNYEKNFFGQIIRRYLAGDFGDPTLIDPLKASKLYMLDRYESAQQIESCLNDGKIIICDRYHGSNLIHQGAKEKDSEQRECLIVLLNHWEFDVFKNPKPDFVVYLHVYPEVAEVLMKKQGRVLDGHESDLDYARMVEQTALWVYHAFGWKKIECCPDRNSILPPEQIHEMIWQAVKNAINGLL